MSSVDLILLGFLYEQPQSAYDIQKQLKFRNLSNWIKIGKATIFKNVLTLEKKGYLSSTTVREGNMPEKTIYSITETGRDYFHQLMADMAGKEISVLFDFNTVIANLYKVPPDEAREYLANIRQNMMGTMTFIQSMVPKRQEIPLVGRTIMKQQIAVLDALIKWLDEFAEEFFREQDKR